MNLKLNIKNNVLKTYMLLLTTVMFVIPSSQNIWAAEYLSSEYQITSDGYIIANTVPEEMIAEMDAVNTSNQHYRVNNNGYISELEPELQDWVYEMCAEYGVAGSEKTIIAKLYCESSFNPDLIHHNTNGTTDHGLAQINSCNHSRLKRTLGITDFMDPYQSIRAGVFMFAESMQENENNESMALVAYNTGRNGIASSKYSRKVLKVRDTMMEAL